jgi:glutaredoxin-like YruB-family protein
MKQVTIYSTPTCPYCKMAKEFFAKNNIKFTDIDVSSDVTKQQEMIGKSGQLAVPVIDIDGDIIVGFNEPKLKDLIGS